MGLDTDTHDQVPLAATASSTPEEQQAAAAYVARQARDEDDRDMLLAALGLTSHPIAFLTVLTATSTGLLAVGWALNRGGRNG